ncbi:hypothetical protein [Helicobacter typhlonius]|uniref:hypothetical protein n=1 Tax=Helicobacter typhlonius TaxID=76936 RepID=UPI002FE1F72A
MENERKYDEFYCSVEQRNLPLECLNDTNYPQYKGNIFCPNCRITKLYFVNQGTPHLRTIPHSIHSESCLYAYEIASTQNSIEYLEKLTNIQMKNKLASLMRRMFYNENSCNKVNNYLDEEINPLLININSPNKEKNIKSLREKSINASFGEEDDGELFVFYGKVKFNFFKQEKNEYAYLQVFVKDKRKFSIKINPNAENLPQNNKEYFFVAIGIFLYKFKEKYPAFQIKLSRDDSIKWKEIHAEHKE